MADYEVPIEVRRMRRGERLNYYAEKYKREGAAYILLENLFTILTEKELQVKIKEVKKLRLRVEQTIKLMENSCFLLLTLNLDSQVRRILKLRKCRATLLTRKWKRKSRGAQNKIENLKQDEDLSLDQALDIELQIVDICDASQIDPLPYLLVHKVVGESYVLEKT